MVKINYVDYPQKYDYNQTIKKGDKMIEQIVSWLVSIYIVFYIPYMIYLNVIQISSKWRCRKKKYSKLFNPCHERGCRFRSYCDEYEHEPRNEYDRIIAEWRKSKEKEGSV